LASSRCYIFLGRQRLLYVWQQLLYFFLASTSCFFLANSPLLCFCLWWNCPTPYIMWNMS
jgi:hypothetical protein